MTTRLTYLSNTLSKSYSFKIEIGSLIFVRNISRTKVRHFSSYISNRNIRNTKVSLPTNYLNVAKRFIGGKPMGHAHKIINAISKTEVPTSASSLSFTPTVSTEPHKKQSVEGIRDKVTSVPSKEPSTIGNTGGISSVRDKIPSGTPPGYHGILNSVKKQPDAIPEVTSMPLPPPLLPPSMEKTLPIATDIKSLLKNEYSKQVSLINKDEVSLLQALRERDLIDWTNKAKSLFYKHLEANPDASTENIVLSEQGFKESQLNLGLLRIDDKTIVLSGTQTHPILLYTLKDYKIIAWGYLTSEADIKNIVLSDYQPFSNKTTKQFLRFITPLIVQAKDIEPLPGEQQSIGLMYLQNTNIRTKLAEKFIGHLESYKTIGTYNGIGFTKQDLINVLYKFESDQSKIAGILFNKYKSMKNISNEDQLKKWLIKIETNNKHTYKYLRKLIEQHETK